MAARSEYIVDFNPKAMGEIVDKDFSEAQMQLRNDLLEHLQRLVGCADYSDLEFFCKDGEKVKASRLLLVGRSDVFDKMLTNGMLESSERVIRLPEISSAVLLYILDILYVGNSALHPLTSWTMALETFRAAHFFFLPNVNRVVRKFMWAQAVQAAETFSYIEAARMLTTAMEVQCIDDEDVVLLELVRLLNVKWMEVDCAINLSEEALGYILRKAILVSKSGLSLDEYFRVRGVVLWGACQGERDLESAREMEELVNAAMPLAEKDLYKAGVIDVDTEITWLPNFLVNHFDNEKLCHRLSETGRKRSVEKLLVHINWSRIPGVLLAKIFRPLQLLSSSKYTEILENHAIHNIERLNCEWVYPDVYATETRGFAIRKSKGGSGWAVCQATAFSRTETLQWRLHLDIVGVEVIQLGVACGAHSLSKNVITGTTLEDSWEEVCAIRVKAHSEPRQCYNKQHYFGDDDRRCVCCRTASKEPTVNLANYDSILAYRQSGTTWSLAVGSSIAILFTCNQEDRWRTANVEGLGIFETVRNLPPGNIFPLVNLGQSAGPESALRL